MNDFYIIIQHTKKQNIIKEKENGQEYAHQRLM